MCRTNTKKNVMGRECGTYGMQESCILGLVGKREGRRLLGRRRHKCDGDIKWVFIVWYGEVLSGLIWPRMGTGGGR